MRWTLALLLLPVAAPALAQEDPLAPVLTDQPAPAPLVMRISWPLSDPAAAANPVKANSLASPPAPLTVPIRRSTEVMTAVIWMTC